MAVISVMAGKSVPQATLRKVYLIEYTERGVLPKINNFA